MLRHWRILNGAGWLGAVAVNAAVATGVLFGKSSGEKSGKVPALFTPAGYVFSMRPAERSTAFTQHAGRRF